LLATQRIFLKGALESLFFASPKKSNQKKGEPPTLPLRGSRQNPIQNGKRKNSPDKTGLRQLSFLIRFGLDFGGNDGAGFSGKGNFNPIPTLALPLKGREHQRHR